jgi:hypothetical protein
MIDLLIVNFFYKNTFFVTSKFNGVMCHLMAH